MAHLALVERLFVDLPNEVSPPPTRAVAQQAALPAHVYRSPCTCLLWRHGQLASASFVAFKAVWRAGRIGDALLVRQTEEDADEYMQDLYRVATDRLNLTSTTPTPAAFTPAATATNDLDTGQPTRLLYERIWIMYTLYTLHECQPMRRKRRIIVHEELWPILEECSRDFSSLPLSDPIFVLHALVDRMIDFHAECPRPLSDGLARDETIQLEARRDDRPRKLLKLTIPREHNGHLHELLDLKSHLSLSELRELSLAYATRMHEMQQTMMSGASAPKRDLAAASRPPPLPSTAHAIDAPHATSTAAIAGISSIASAVLPSTVRVDSVLSAATLKLLTRVEQALETHHLHSLQQAAGAAVSAAPPDVKPPPVPLLPALPLPPIAAQTHPSPSTHSRPFVASMQPSSASVSTNRVHALADTRAIAAAVAAATAAATSTAPTPPPLSTGADLDLMRHAQLFLFTPLPASSAAPPEAEERKSNAPEEHESSAAAAGKKPPRTQRKTAASSVSTAGERRHVR